MRPMVCALIAGVMAAGTMVVAAGSPGQAGDVNKVLAEARQALGGEKKLASVKTLVASGTSTRVMGDRSMPPADVELAFELPDKFMKKDVMGMMNNVALTRTSGFNGDAVIDAMDAPPALGGGISMIRMAGPGQPAGGPLTPEQQAEVRKRSLLASKQEYARLALGMLAPELPSYPLNYAYGGQAESPDGKADIINVTGEGDFAVRLFIDSATHLPLMLSWMAREPLSRTITRGGPGAPGGALPPGASVSTSVAGGAHFQANVQSGGSMTPEEREKLQKQMEQEMKDAQAKARIVEYRVYYSDYRDVDGIKVPFRTQRSIDGKPTEEVAFEKVKVNGKIDPKKFEAK